MALSLQTGTTNEVLRTKSQPVHNFTKDLKNFSLEMIKVMKSENGVGLAAPQVGKNIRLIVCTLNPTDNNETIVVMVNPKIEQASEEKEIGEEGCLSVPDTWGNVERSKEVVVKYKNIQGKEFCLILNSLNARIVQHEIDHLDGILFTDKATDVELKTSKKKKKTL